MRVAIISSCKMDSKSHAHTEAQLHMLMQPQINLDITFRDCYTTSNTHIYIHSYGECAIIKLMEPPDNNKFDILITGE